MKRTAFALLAAVAASPATAQDQRALGAHEHGVGQLDVAVEGTRVAIELRAPGADIVGFEHHAASAEDRAAVDDAVAALARPLDLFVLPEAAQCSVIEARAGLAGEDEHHDEHEEDHAEGEEHAEHEEHDEEHANSEGGGAEHSEFHAEYALTCADPGAIDRIEFAYFATFPNARELEVQMISDRGAERFEVERDAPVLDLQGRI